jgi:hypothetical protein
MALPWSLAKVLGVRPEKTQARPLKTYSSAAAATAQTHYIDIPTDHFIHCILLKCLESVSGTPTTLDDFISAIRLIGDGSKYLKQMTGGMAKQIQIVNFENPATGFYKLYFKDPRIEASKPLPSWVFTSLTLEIDDIAPATGEKNYIYPTVIEEMYGGQDLTNWRALVEKYSKWSKFGTNTGEQEYLHERAYDVYGYLLAMDDNGTLSNTAFDKLTLKGITRDAEYNLLDKVDIPTLREQNKLEFKNALGTGYAMVEFPQGLPSHMFTSLKSILNIPSAGTNVGVRILERYLL